MKRILFLIHDLGPGGAEKVLVNLVNGIDRSKFDVSLRTLFDWGPNREALAPDVRYSSWFPRNIPANSHWMKLWTPARLWKMIVPEKYDIVVSFLEGPCARVAGGCPEDGTKAVFWIHTPILNEKKFTEGFRSRDEAERCYGRADALVFVSEDVRSAFLKQYRPARTTAVLHNVFESGRIRQAAGEDPIDPSMDRTLLNWCGVGKLIPLKGWDRMLRIQRKLIDEGFPAHFWLIGDGPQRQELEHLADQLGIRDTVTFAGYRSNPYAYISRCILYVCASEREGFSTAAVEALLCGTPVCSVDVGGMKEILGSGGEYGVVTDNTDEALYPAVRRFFADPGYRQAYQEKAGRRGREFDRDSAVGKIGEFLLSL